MFDLNVSSVSYTDPWAAPFEVRLAALVKGDRRVAYFYENPDNSTFRYRVYNMIQALEKSQNRISSAYFFQNDLDRLIEVVDLADVIVICRSRYCDKLNRAITQARNKGKRVFFDVDDLVFDTTYTHLIVHTLDQDLNHPNVWDHWFSYIARIGATLQLCDGVITTNSFLAARVQDYAKKPVFVIPNFLNHEQIEISKQIFGEKLDCNFSRNNQINIGYFSGTPSHNKDFEIVSESLVRLLKKDARVSLRVVGFMDLKEPLLSYSSRIEFYPLHDFINLQRLIGQVEINLVPLQDNVFTNCKSELKYFEAAIAGTLSIASPVFTYANAIRDGENGYLARAFEWDEKLEMLLDSFDLYPEMAQKAFKDAEQKFAWYNQVDLIEKTLFS